ncbi:hypothetical protein [Faecalibaculum rodentium]|uniref:hypothetical protein n=1 Tax=Faecalibaculum rodentium TaxID=1702221 RepID=UPI0008313A0B|nr:hypothetical protein [Faecalibaculum rodentium]
MNAAARLFIRNQYFNIDNLFRNFDPENIKWHLKVMLYTPDYSWFNTCAIASNDSFRRSGLYRAQPLDEWSQESPEGVTDKDFTILFPLLDQSDPRITFALEQLYTVRDFNMADEIDTEDPPLIQDVLRSGRFSDLKEALSEGWRKRLMESWLSKCKYYKCANDEEKRFLENCYIYAFSRTDLAEQHDLDWKLSRKPEDSVALYRAMHQIICDYPGMIASWLVSLQQSKSMHKKRLSAAVLSSIRKGQS